MNDEKGGDSWRVSRHFLRGLERRPAEHTRKHCYRAEIGNFYFKEKRGKENRPAQIVEFRTGLIKAGSCIVVG